ncbi:MAG: hypothetical protein FJZ11_07015 [Candidatus Omnitrophica bacterium]|nr:hypothetical protein [Candidatus Omnitrophota bacterium]
MSKRKNKTKSAVKASSCQKTGKEYKLRLCYICDKKIDNEYSFEVFGENEIEVIYLCNKCMDIMDIKEDL